MEGEQGRESSKGFTSHADDSWPFLCSFVSSCDGKLWLSKMQSPKMWVVFGLGP